MFKFAYLAAIVVVAVALSVSLFGALNTVIGAMLLVIAVIALVNHFDRKFKHIKSSP